MKRLLMVAVMLVGMFLTHRAHAQRLVLGGGVGAATGVEGGDAGNGTAFRRARSRLVLTMDSRVDEDMKQGLGIIAFGEFEPHVSFGGELRYMRWFSPSLVGVVGGTGVIAPQSLLGGVAGLQIHVPLDESGTTVFFEPSFSVLPLGKDLPEDKIIFWGLLTVGIHAKL